jgi:hypothetical protein
VHCTLTRHSCSSTPSTRASAPCSTRACPSGASSTAATPNPQRSPPDFSRFDFVFWTTVEEADARNAARRRKLEALNTWRNAIAHHDIDSNRADLHPREVTLATCNSWRAALNGLAESFDRVLADHLATLLDSRPW